jgi:DNA primase
MRYAKELYFCYDSDEAGQQATIRALSIAARDTGAVVKVITVPDGKDPDEFIRKHGAEAFRALVKEAMPLVDYRISYVLSHVPYGTLEGKGRALQEIMPVLTGVSQALLGEYVKKLAQTLMIDEGLVLEELRRYRRAPVDLPEPERAPIRQVVREKDTAAKRAGRLIIRAAWQDPGIILHTLTVVPLEGIADPVQREVLSLLQDCASSGESPADAAGQERLSEEAAAELSRALVEDLGGREEAEAYTDSLRNLRMAYLKSQYLAHTEKAEAMMQAGDMTYLEELNEVKRIKDEMDGM